MARIENHKYSIEEAFRECFYIVPDYQREYVWTDKEVHQLLEDINEQIDAGSTREYFIGTVLVSPTDQKNHYEVIDGQQRLTTFFLLLCALKHVFQAEPQRQTVSGLISTSYTDSDGETRTSLKLEPRYESAGGVGGVRAAVVNVRGPGVWSAMNFEAGVHSVKRVPATEAQGRIHTSTATVAVLAEPEAVDVKIDWSADVEESATRAQGPGGQGRRTPGPT